MIQPTAKQAQIRDLQDPSLLVIAPAGCGKTEALALRIQGMLKRGDVAAPRKVLVITFSKRARDNIRERLHSYLPAAALRDRVTVTNFHGLAARLIRAHAAVLGLSTDLLLPENDWVGQRCRELGFGKQTSSVQRDLREAKQERRTDQEVEEYLRQPGRELALRVEQDRVAEGRLTYDDLPRLAELILADEKVAELYRSHFSAVVVDEFQDLTPQQLRIVTAIGHRRTTYAGDLAQGIYGFAGARPEEIDAVVRAECSSVIEFSESHRSSPAVLATVNSLTSLTFGTKLTSANPQSWPHGGLSACVSHATAEDEASWVVQYASRIVELSPQHRIAVIARTGPRRRFADKAFDDAGVETYRWDDVVLDTDTAQTLRGLLRRVDVPSFVDADDRLAHLRELVDLESVIDVREGLHEALAWVHDLLLDEIPPEDIRKRIRVGNGSTLTNQPGVHLLTGHAGKGQQFDWVFVLGMEDDSVPFYRSTSPDAIAEEARVLSVMISRARHGVILSYADSVPDFYENPRRKQPSRFLAQLAAANPLSTNELRAWLRSADWTALSNR